MHASGSLSPADPVFKKEETEDGKSRIQFTARFWIEARGFLSGIKKKFPEVDYAPIENELRMTSTPLTEPLHLTLDVGGPVAGRSIVKSVLAMACELGIPMMHCSSGIEYLREEGAETPWAAFHLRNLIKNRPSEFLFHTVAVSGDPATGLFLGYVEYFCAFRFVVVLNRTYRGPVVRDAYAINPVTGDEIDFEIDLTLSEAEVDHVVRNDLCLYDALKVNMELALPIVLKVANDNGREQILDNIITTAFQDCGTDPNGVLLPERYAEFSALVAQRCAEVLVRRNYPPS